MIMVGPPEPGGEWMRVRLYIIYDSHTRTDDVDDISVRNNNNNFALHVAKTYCVDGIFIKQQPRE